MYEQHLGFNPPPEEATLWKYMDFPKFVDLLTRGSLFFCRVEQLRDPQSGDPFEGSLSQASYDAMYRGQRRETVEIWRRKAPLIDFLRRIRMVNCWHRSDYESDAMWKIYTGQNEGIAIKTDFASLAASFIGDEPIYIGEVTYIDYNIDVIPDELVLQALLYKRNHFEHEREVRVVKEPQDKSNLPAAGEYSPVDLSLLIQDVIVSPLSPDWFTALVQSVADQYALRVNVKPSALTTPPAKG